MKVIDPLPQYEGQFITSDELLDFIKKADQSGCVDSENRPLLTILDLRNENFLSTQAAMPSIETRCKTIAALLDDLPNPEIRQQIPSQGVVVTVTETGNRDIFVMKYLYKFGHKNIKGLRFGMRGWIKLDYPVIYGKRTDHE